MPGAVSNRTIARLSVYRRLLGERFAGQGAHVYSHDLAAAAGVTAAQVRRDVMVVGYSGSPTRGYESAELARSIGRYLDGPDSQFVGLVGVGNLGRALLAFFSGRRPNLTIVAGFDKNPQRVGRVIRGCRCYPMAELESVIAREGITIGVIAVPAEQAQNVCDELVRAGVRGLVNFAPCPLRTPPHVHVEDVDITTSLEKAAFFARQSARTKSNSQPRGVGQ